MAERLVRCSDHGPSQFCHVNEDGSHADPNYCQCGLFGLGRATCPIDSHRDACNVFRPRSPLAVQPDLFGEWEKQS
jgi:hypothetical protein